MSGCKLTWWRWVHSNYGRPRFGLNSSDKERSPCLPRQHLLLPWHVHQLDGSAFWIWTQVVLYPALPQDCRNRKSVCGNTYRAWTALILRSGWCCSGFISSWACKWKSKAAGEIGWTRYQRAENAGVSKGRLKKIHLHLFFPFAISPPPLCVLIPLWFFFPVNCQPISPKSSKPQLDACYTLISDRFHHPKPFRICTSALCWPQRRLLEEIAVLSCAVKGLKRLKVMSSVRLWFRLLLKGQLRSSIVNTTLFPPNNLI